MLLRYKIATRIEMNRNKGIWLFLKMIFTRMWYSLLKSFVRRPVSFKQQMPLPQKRQENVLKFWFFWLRAGKKYSLIWKTSRQKTWFGFTETNFCETAVKQQWLKNNQNKISNRRKYDRIGFALSFHDSAVLVTTLKTHTPRETE